MRKSTLVIGTLLVTNIVLSSLILTQVNAQFAGDSEQSTSPAGKESEQSSPVVAIYNGKKITESQLRPYLNELASAEQLDSGGSIKSAPVETIQAALNNMIIDTAIMDRAKAAEVDQDKRLQAVLNQNRRRVVKNVYLDSVAPTLVSDQQVLQEYEKLKASLEGKIEYRARHILLGSEKEARIIVKALEEEERPFSELAQLFSLDEATAHRGGDLGYQLPGQLNADFESVVSELELDTVSAPFKTSLGWHVAIVDDRRESKAMPYEEAAPVIRRKLEQRAIREYLESILAEAEIEVVMKQPTQDPATSGNSQAETGNDDQ